MEKVFRRKRSIVRRWLWNSVGITLFLIIVVSVVLMFSISRLFYGGVRQTIQARTEILTNLFVANNRSETTELMKAAREFVETFEEKESMELMIFDRQGNLLITSTGFEPDSEQEMPDYQEAVKSESGTGIWAGKLRSGENVMASTMVFSVSEKNSGAIRIIVSLEQIDDQILLWGIVIACVGAAVLLFIILTGLYFVRSIIIPVKEIGRTAQKVAKGDFDARLKNKYNDEIGDLCDNINEMAHELRNAEQMKNDFISSVSHELRTPLTAIKGWAETVRDSGQSDPEMTARGLEVISKESERLTGLVEELLDFSRLQSGRMKLQLQWMDLVAELDETVYMLKDHARRRNITLICNEIGKEIPPIIGDAKRIAQVFFNVIENAIKYSDNNGKVTVSIFPDQDWIRVVVTDNGCGIAPEDLPKVKEKFYKANMTRGGSGIGLAVADEIVRLHNGILEIESELGTGTMVTITLPIGKNALKKGTIQ